MSILFDVCSGVSSFNHFIHELSVDSDSDGSSLDYPYGDEGSSDGDTSPGSPLSQSSRVSRASSFSRNDRHWMGWMWIRYIFFWILLPARFLLGIPVCIFQSSYSRSSNGSSAPGSSQVLQARAINRMQTLKDHIVHRTTDRRRGVIEDLHLAIEIFIEAIFDVVHKAAHFILSPSEAFKTLSGWYSLSSSGAQDSHDSDSEVSVPTATLGENDPAPKERNTSFQQSLNTDARTCQDVITELGYPYEAIHVITSDGYVLLLERLPRYWQYSINEHATQDIPAMIEKIHQVKTAELKLSQPDLEEEINDEQPYKLCAICHSLGGAAILMYVVTQRIEERPHRLSRLVLLSPAGFHGDSSLMFTVVEHVLLLLAPILAPLVPGFYIPTRFFRMLLNKLARDFHNYPAVGGLVQTLMSYFVGGDSSNWVGVLGIPHYNMNDMPGVSFQVALHLAQMKHAGQFRMFDYGSASANMEVYGSTEPLDLGEYYGLIDVPVDLVAGRKDKVIRPSMVRKHYKLMNDAGVDVSYSEFEYAHLDFTFSHREELLAYVMSRLLLVEPSPNQQSSQKALRLKKKGQVNS
ncbi:hypothetical protein ACE6H2_018440 [Prunus campanulata]